MCLFHWITFAVVFLRNLIGKLLRQKSLLSLSQVLSKLWKTGLWFNMLKTTLKSWKDNTLCLQEETWLQGMQFSQLHQHVHLHGSIRSRMVKLIRGIFLFFAVQDFQLRANLLEMTSLNYIVIHMRKFESKSGLPRMLLRLFFEVNWILPICIKNEILCYFVILHY